MADTTLTKTRLGTSDDVSLCKGFALFPAVGTARADVKSTDQTKELINRSQGIGVGTLNCRVAYQLIVGVCGPSYAVAFSMNGSVTSDSSSFELSDDKTRAGFFVGITLRLIFALQFKPSAVGKVFGFFAPKTNTRLVSALNTNLDESVDLIELAFTALLGSLQKKGKNKLLEKVSNISPAQKNSWGMEDTNEGDFSSKGYVVLNPNVDVPINLIPLVPALKPIVSGLEFVGATLFCGPNIGLVIPVTLSLQNIVLTDTDDNKVTFTPIPHEDDELKKAVPAKGGTVNANGSSALNGELKDVAVQLSHSPGFDIKVTVSYKIALAKYFDLGANYGFNLLETLGIRPVGGPYSNTVSNTAGASSTGRAVPIPRALGEMMENGSGMPAESTGYRLPRIAFDTSGVSGGAKAASAQTMREAVLA